jgi:uncharacterized SAM-binding protein YcdF (DUF218 family)
LKKRRIIWLLPAALFLLITPVYLFIEALGAPADEFSYADAIVVLTGGSGRVEEGLRLFREGRGGCLIISGVEGSSRLDAIFPGRDINSMVDTSRILLDTESGSTIENARNVKRIIEGRGIRSLVLVTSNYHMKRAYAIFSASLGDAMIYRYPVKGPNFMVDRWWADRNSLRLVGSEFLKYIWFHAVQRWVEL